MFFFKFVKCFLVYVIFLMRVYEQQTLKRIIIARILKPDIIATTLCSRLVYNNHKIKKPKSYFL